MSSSSSVAGLGRAGVVLAGLSFSIGDVSDIWRGIVMTSVSMMSSMMACACVPVRSMKWNDVLYMPDRYAYGVSLKERVGDWEWADMMALYCQNVTEEDSEFVRRMGVLLEEIEAAYNERVDFIKELEVVPGVDAAVKTAEFLNDALEITEDLRLAREINALYVCVTAIVDQREMFVDELDMLAGRHVPDKMADFMKQWVPGVRVSSLMGSLVPLIGCAANIVHG
uniref:Uncharacterized protein n=1 Tax=Tanacetum cinerariifolium TaxID=118510 RepID=A0A699H0L5_TANCI|nr:hypothetical protein [Tanacetum cinerariifolium]